ncbi:hypothetical protein DRJ71_16885 [Enterococcus faecalis]|nr:hypothetical protein DRJ71_16885 [Enterococcus faecalis]
MGSFVGVGRQLLPCGRLTPGKGFLVGVERQFWAFNSEAKYGLLYIAEKPWMLAFIVFESTSFRLL